MDSSSTKPGGLKIAGVPVHSSTVISVPGADVPEESKLVTTLLILFQLRQLFVYVDSQTANTHRVVNSANLQ